jgi:hypothetical protein
MKTGSACMDMSKKMIQKGSYSADSLLAELLGLVSAFAGTARA